MPLRLIKGPLNSGRTGRIRALVDERADAGPVIVAPSGDARYSLEAELCEERGAAIGPLVIGFLDLARMVAEAGGLGNRPLASAAQRRHLITRAKSAARLRILAESASRPGFTAALERLFGELRAAGVDQLEIDPEDRYLGELLAIYETYVAELARAELSDEAGLIDAAAGVLKLNPDSWARRPVFMHGFDDLAPDQLRLVEALARATEVTISLTYEDRHSLRARSRLLGLLEDLGGSVIEEMPPVPGFTPNPLLFHLERQFGEPEPEPAPADLGGLRVILSAGERGEAEAVAGEIKRLIVAGTPASGIAIALRTPNRGGPELARALRAVGVPVALETEIALGATATGQALADLAAAVLAGRSAEALVRLARGVGLAAADPDLADALEWMVRRGRIEDSDEALAALERSQGVSFAEIEEVRRAAAAGVGVLAEWLTGFTAEAAERAGGMLELRAARTIANTASELAPLAVDSAELLAGLLALELRTWSGPTGERVRIASPYTLRTTRFKHLFVCSLQEGEFPRRGSDGPFLSEAQRARLGLPERADSEAEEIYLFQICLSLPEESLWLSARTADADGGAEQTSPFLAQVEALAGMAVARTSYDLGRVAPEPERASNETEIARSLLLAGQPAASEFVADGETAARIEARIEQAIRRQRLAARPRPLGQPAVLAELGSRQTFGATGLEAFLRYPYHWFIGRELEPEPLDRDDHHLVDGSLIHAVLQQLYSDPPSPVKRPTPANLSAWQKRGGELLEAEARRMGLNSRFVADRVRLRRMGGFLRNFLAQEAGNSELAVEPAIFEASFGGEGERPALTEAGWALRGKIDRVDLTADRTSGLLHDYKYAARADGLEQFERKGLLQLPLYMAALKRIWGIEPLGGLYRALRARPDRGQDSRGMLSVAALNGPLAGIRHKSTDLIDAAEMQMLIEEALAQAGELVAAIRAGQIDREPLPDAYTDVASWAAIDRRVGGGDDDEDEEEYR